MDSLKSGESTLLLWNDSERSSDDCQRISQKLSEKVGTESLLNPSSNSTTQLEANKFETVVLSKVLISPLNSVENIKLLADISRILKPNGKLIVLQPKSEDLESTLVLSGFNNPTVSSNPAFGDCFEIISTKPSFEIGSSKKLNLDALAVWDAVQKEGGKPEDIIDPDQLVDDEDFAKPDAASLMVCGTTGKKTPCKNCSCGLDKVVAAKSAGDKPPAPQEQPKSSCGSCYLGDAFRCASCPYLGMPAFKPGEKVTLSASMLQDDI
ncbi:anamorsin homolog [Cloeon dipterum]|uniref:anamorsin homolog n=1 Tax=Cloeon dipterum TaxID=197152 RepID=UPI00321F84A0